jgi:hypothetical protein
MARLSIQSERVKHLVDTQVLPFVDFHPILTRGFHLKLTHGLCA